MSHELSLRQQLDTALRERDEARAQLATVTAERATQIRQSVYYQQRRNELLAERDSLAALLRECGYLLEAHLFGYVAPSSDLRALRSRIAAATKQPEPTTAAAVEKFTT